MSSSSDKAVPVTEDVVAAAAKEALAWGQRRRRWTSHRYLSYGMVAMKGMCPALTDVVDAAPSFTELSPPMRLDFLAMLEGRSLGAASGECERLLALLRDAVARQVNMELLADTPRFLDGTTSPFRWWVTTLREAFLAFHEEVAACSRGKHGEDDAPIATTATSAIIALVLERYLVLGTCGASKAVLCRDGELIDLSFDALDMANRGGDENKQSVEKCVPVAADIVDVVVVEWQARDEFLILGNAALWEGLTPAAACAHVRGRLGRTLRVTTPSEMRIIDAEGSTTLIAKELAKKALHAGGSRDNVSVGLVVFKDSCAGHAVSTTVHRPAQTQATPHDQACRPTRNRRTPKPNSKVYGPMWQN